MLDGGDQRYEIHAAAPRPRSRGVPVLGKKDITDGLERDRPSIAPRTLTLLNSELLHYVAAAGAPAFRRLNSFAHVNSITAYNTGMKNTPSMV